MARPFVLLNAAVSADGKIAPASRARVRLGSARDRRRMDLLRSSADAILIGAGTLRAEDPPLQVRSEALRRRRVRAGLRAELTTIVLSRSLDLPFEARFFRDPGARRMLVAPLAAPRRRLADARLRAEVLLVGRRRVEPGLLLARLGRRGVRRLLIEGGGETYALFLRAGLVDELHLTVCPFLIGGRDAPTLFDGEGFEAGALPPLILDFSRREGDEVYLRYHRSAHAGSAHAGSAHAGSAHAGSAHAGQAHAGSARAGPGQRPGRGAQQRSREQARSLDRPGRRRYRRAR